MSRFAYMQNQCDPWPACLTKQGWRSNEITSMKILHKFQSMSYSLIKWELNKAMAMSFSPLNLWCSVMPSIKQIVSKCFKKFYVIFLLIINNHYNKWWICFRSFRKYQVFKNSSITTVKIYLLTFKHILFLSSFNKFFWLCTGLSSHDKDWGMQERTSQKTTPHPLWWDRCAGGDWLPFGIGVTSLNLSCTWNEMLRLLWEGRDPAPRGRK